MGEMELPSRQRLRYVLAADATLDLILIRRLSTARAIVV